MEEEPVPAPQVPLLPPSATDRHPMTAVPPSIWLNAVFCAATVKVKREKTDAPAAARRSVEVPLFVRNCAWLT